MNLQYNYPEILAWLEQKGKQDYGDKFHFKQQDTPNITKLVAYFLKDETKTNEYGIDLTQSYMIGDKLIDLECGWNAGVRRSILVRTGYGAGVETKEKEKLRDAAVVDDICAAVDWILKDSR